MTAKFTKIETGYIASIAFSGNKENIYIKGVGATQEEAFSNLLSNKKDIEQILFNVEITRL
jgi:hypothetical protein